MRTIPVVGSLQERALARDREHRLRLDHEVEKRRAQEKDLSRGQPVWFSRRIENGELHHWALFTHRHKYELRLKGRHNTRRVAGRLASSAVPSARFEAKISPWTMERQMMVTRIIAWPEGRALDYDWFMYNLETPYNKMLKISPDKNIQRHQTYLGASLGVMLGATGFATWDIITQEPSTTGQVMTTDPSSFGDIGGNQDSSGCCCCGGDGDGGCCSCCDGGCCSCDCCGGDCCCGDCCGGDCGASCCNACCAGAGSSGDCDPSGCCLGC